MHTVVIIKSFIILQVYDKNQGNSQLNRWEVLPEQNETISSSTSTIPKYSIMYNISTYEEFWEPPLILSATAPGFDERFIGYGFTRSSQVRNKAKTAF